MILLHLCDGVDGDACEEGAEGTQHSTRRSLPKALRGRAGEQLRARLEGCLEGTVSAFACGCVCQYCQGVEDLAEG